MTKKETAKVDYDDGVLFHLDGKPKPRHLRFSCKTSSDGSAEACDLRLAKRRANSHSWPQDDSQSATENTSEEEKA